MQEVADFDSWYRRQHPRLTSALMSMCGERSLAEDVAAEAFARALERWERVRFMESPEAWTYRVAVNHLRRAKRRDSIERKLLGRRTRSTPRATGSAATGAGWDMDVLHAIGDLPPRQRTAIALHYVADLSVADTASAMDITVGSVTSTLHQARRTLATTLGLDDEEAP